MTQSERVDGRGGVDVALVRRLVASQFPQWADLPVRLVDFDGWDNRTYRLGEDMLVRLPSGDGCAPQVEKEQRWLPKLAPLLPLPIPAPVAQGQPAEGYRHHWSVYRWLDGDTADVGRIDDLNQFAIDVGDFLAALQKVDTAGGPIAGAHSAYRGAPLSTYDAETRRCIAALGDRIAADKALAVWDTALAAAWDGPAVWFHGDVAVGNLLVVDGRLFAVIDFGCSGVGDPACDLVMAWTFFTGSSREAFRAAVPGDSGTWARGRGWALWKALLLLAGNLGDNPDATGPDRQVVEDVIAEHEHELGI
jgi:aminoglycoside phosphotransferase (APT) family kinase protein